VQRFSNITSIDLTTIQSALERIVSSVVLAVRFMALFSLATGPSCSSARSRPAGFNG
jgi:predicted lysophospholipase L1 biosynthesis ABC-type transport system permease subunit